VEAVSRKEKIPFGCVNLKTSILRCTHCGKETELESDGAELARQIKEAQRASVRVMLESLKERDVSAAAIERAFGLSPRTANRWKQEGEFSASSLALLRTLATFPWLVEVAETNFDLDIAEATLIGAAEQVLAKHGIDAKLVEATPTQPSNNVIHLSTARQQVRPDNMVIVAEA